MALQNGAKYIFFTLGRVKKGPQWPLGRSSGQLNREFKQITKAGATTAVVTEKVWGEYVSVVYKY